MAVTNDLNTPGWVYATLRDQQHGGERPVPHWFDAGAELSLCGRVPRPTRNRVDTDPARYPDDCRRCASRLVKRTAKAIKRRRRQLHGGNRPRGKKGRRT